jgi:hypothetical protein
MALPLLAACAGAPPPTERMATTQGAIRAAQEVGADRVPEAQLHVKLAEEQVQKARQLMDKGDNRRADLMLQRANADAELGLSLAREQITRDQAQRVLWQTRDLQQRGQ